MDEDLKEPILIIFGATLLVGLMFFGICVADYFYVKHIECPKTGRTMNMEYKFDYFAEGSGCFLKTKDGRFVPADTYTGVNLDK